MVYFEEATLRFDGSCSPNPGAGGSGYQIFDTSSHNTIIEGRYYVGERCTNNVAEYFGVIAGLKRLRDSPHHIGHLTIEGDSELVINHLERTYRVKSPRMKKLNLIVCRLITRCKGREFKKLSYVHIDRRFNEEADRLANDARIEKKNWSQDRYT